MLNQSEIRASCEKLAAPGRADALINLIGMLMQQAKIDERELCARLVEAEGTCRHVEHSQGLCACYDKADLIRSRR